MPESPLTVMEEAPDLAVLLVKQLRLAADEIDSARRFGVPIPPTVNVHAFSHSAGLTFSANEHEFAAWVDYTEAEVEEYEHSGQHWSRASVDVNGLKVGFAWGRPLEAVSEATA